MMEISKLLKAFIDFEISEAFKKTAKEISRMYFPFNQSFAERHTFWVNKMLRLPPKRISFPLTVTCSKYDCNKRLTAVDILITCECGVK